MKKGVNLWCFPDNFTIQTCMKSASAFRFNGIEINMEEKNSDQDDVRLTLDSSEKDITRIKHLAQSYGLDIPSISTSLLWRNLLCSENSSEREKAKTVVKKMIDAAVLLGADTVLVVPGAVNDNNSYANAYRRSVETLRELAPYAESNKIYIGVENVWNKMLLSPLEMLSFLDHIGSPYVKVYFDAGNVVEFSYPEYWIEILGQRIHKVHVKDYSRSTRNFVNLLEGDVQWNQVMTALRKVNYLGYLTAELTPYRLYPEVLIHQTSIAMDAILQT